MNDAGIAKKVTISISWILRFIGLNIKLNHKQKYSCKLG